MKYSVRYLIAKALKKTRGSAVTNSNIHTTSKVESGSQITNVSMGRHSFCGYNCEITNAEIGAFCSIANGVIIGGGMHPVDWVSTSPVFYEGRDSVRKKFSEHARKQPENVVVGHDVWIGQNALIKQGVNIGTGSVIGMGSVVTKDVPAYSIVAGNPARLIRMRFSEDIIESLIESKWWLFSDSKLATLGHTVTSPVDFIDKLSQI
ncbi:CatB-related O-acetyltransferase [Shewanella gaetbuli]